jgi:hypothetical protein
MEPANKRMEGLNKMLDELMRAFRDRAAVMRRPLWNISRVYSNQHDDSDLDDAPDACVGARLRPHRPLGGSAIALPEPDADLSTDAIGSTAHHR